MTLEQAINILHPDTCMETLAEIEYYAGFDGHHAVWQAVRDARLMACEVMRREAEKQQRAKDERL